MELEMTTCEALEEIRKCAGLSRSEVSRRIGRSNTFLTSSLQREGSMRADLLSTVAAVCGYRLILVPNDETKDCIEIKPFDIKPPKSSECN